MQPLAAGLGKCEESKMSQVRILQWGKTKEKVEEPISVDKADRRNICSAVYFSRKCQVEFIHF